MGAVGEGVAEGGGGDLGGAGRGYFAAFFFVAGMEGDGVLEGKGGDVGVGDEDDAGAGCGGFGTGGFECGEAAVA